MKIKICYKDLVVSPSYLNLLGYHKMLFQETIFGPCISKAIRGPCFEKIISWARGVYPDPLDYANIIVFPRLYY